MIVKTCLFCGKVFKVRDSRNNYCSRSCGANGGNLAAGRKLHPKKKSPREYMLERLSARDAAYEAWKIDNGVAEDRQTVYAGVAVVNRGTVPVGARASRNVLEVSRT